MGKTFPARQSMNRFKKNHQSSTKGGIMESRETGSTLYGTEEEKRTPGQEAGTKAKTVISEKKGQFTERLDSFLGALKQTSEQLKQEESGQQIAGLMEKLTGKVEQASSYLHEKDVEDLKIEGERLVRERPAIVLTGVFITGFILARVLKNAGKPAMREWKQSGGYYGGNQ
jgi:hypothetical protein